jgi:hypothetical protein
MTLGSDFPCGLTRSPKHDGRAGNASSDRPEPGGARRPGCPVGHEGDTYAAILALSESLPSTA